MRRDVFMTFLIRWDAQLRTSAEDDKTLVVNFGVWGRFHEPLGRITKPLDRQGKALERSNEP